MARTPPTRVRWWRWRRNPLKRPADIVEAWLVLLLWLSAVAAAALAGVLAGVMSAEHLERQRTERQRVSAVLLEDAEPRSSSRVGTAPVWVGVRWTGPEGAPRTDRTRVEPGTRAGTRIMVWTDPQGRLTARPLSPSTGMLQATATGVLAATVAVAVVLGAAPAGRCLLDRRRMRQWEEEWRQADLRWGGKTF
ncbi:hypothetical protein U5640_22780 [Streptomyces sp. SS7]|uniref:Rv1733c family protein n=1 Tax=Streptomyces sp. SS7 TaxID=3108485 RepID=UPI0030EDEBAF